MDVIGQTKIRIHFQTLAFNFAPSPAFHVAWSRHISLLREIGNSIIFLKELLRENGAIPNFAVTQLILLRFCSKFQVDPLSGWFFISQLDNVQLPIFSELFPKKCKNFHLTLKNTTNMKKFRNFSDSFFLPKVFLKTLVKHIFHIWPRFEAQIPGSEKKL